MKSTDKDPDPVQVVYIILCCCLLMVGTQFFKLSNASSNLVSNANYKENIMSNLWINWRFGVRHLQIGPDQPWITFSVNQYHITHKPEKWFKIY